MRALADELTQSQRYAELLRAQTHEFTNRLHTLAGLLHLGETREALALIHAQSARHEAHLQAVGALRHVRLSALLLGKFDRAAERGVTLALDPLSALLTTLPPGVLDLLELAAGNLIENALDATQGQPDAEVRVLIATDPEGLILEVRDTGWRARGAGRHPDRARREQQGYGAGRGAGSGVRPRAGARRDPRS